MTQENTEQIKTETPTPALPKCLKIGYQYYEIRKVSDPDHFVKAEGDYGLVDFRKSIIYLNDDLNEVDEAQTLLHEALHVINANAGCGWQNTSTWTEENYVIAGANGICQLFQDNPAFVAYFLTNLHIVNVEDLLCPPETIN